MNEQTNKQTVQNNDKGALYHSFYSFQLNPGPDPDPFQRATAFRADGTKTTHGGAVARND